MSPVCRSCVFGQGMTGAFSARRGGGDGGALGPLEDVVLAYKEFKVDTSQWPPKFTKCVLVADDGVEVGACQPLACYARTHSRILPTAHTGVQRTSTHSPVAAPCVARA
jgi:hypothetical protein